jgi:hypothetical protein
MFTLALAAPARSQTPLPPISEPTSLSGPRFGVTVLSDGIVNKLKQETDITVAPVVSQFGWQFEKQWATVDGGPSAVTEWVLLFGGLDQGIVLPSLSWLAGMRTRSGTEFGVGPNITPVGVALALAAGKTFRAGVLNVPVNVAVVPSKSGVRVSMLTGFSLRRP